MEKEVNKVQGIPENIQIIEFRYFQIFSDLNLVMPWRYLPAYAASAWLRDFLSLCRNQLMERLVSQLMG